MTTTLSKRLLRELQEYRRSAPPELPQLEPLKDDDLLEWRATIAGPSDTPFEGGKFKLLISIPPTYPLKPPTMRFVTPVCHPNVNFHTGEICLDILKGSWTPAWTLKSTCLALIVLLANPAPDSPLNCDAANILRCGDYLAYDSLVKMYVQLYAL
ncbi:ubiquitin-conjugating enzyme [Ramicandelaber brevisporus]|nr:ubiquitin-conjugating enzyme [Ramicandelaber brevisporus]